MKATYSAVAINFVEGTYFPIVTHPAPAHAFRGSTICILPREEARVFGYLDQYTKISGKRPWQAQSQPHYLPC